MLAIFDHPVQQEIFDRAVVEYVDKHGTICWTELLWMKEAVASIELDKEESDGPTEERPPTTKRLGSLS